MLVFISLPTSGISNPDSKEDLISNIPSVNVISWEEKEWWESTSRDLNRNKIVDWLEDVDEEYPIGIIRGNRFSEDLELLRNIGIEVKVHVDLVNGLLLL